jgi:hypothetical protein
MPDELLRGLEISAFWGFMEWSRLVLVRSILVHTACESRVPDP